MLIDNLGILPAVLGYCNLPRFSANEREGQDHFYPANNEVLGRYGHNGLHKVMVPFVL
jgi:hypothetical protein